MLMLLGVSALRPRVQESPLWLHPRNQRVAPASRLAWPSHSGVAPALPLASEGPSCAGPILSWLALASLPYSRGKFGDHARTWGWAASSLEVPPVMPGIAAT